MGATVANFWVMTRTVLEQPTRNLVLDLHNTAVRSILMLVKDNYKCYSWRSAMLTADLTKWVLRHNV